MKGINFKKYLPDFSQSKLPSWNQWKQLPKVLTKLDKLTLLFLIVIFLSSSIFLGVHCYYQQTVVRPARGGTFTEGMTGQPRFINPVYVSSNDVDRSLVQLTFAGLMQYEDGKIVPDLAKNVHTDQGKTWTVTLKDDLTWQDGQPITAEDVVFTVNVLQDSDYKSPQRVNWVGVNATKISPQKVKFELDSAYPQFRENLTLKIIPKHIWKNIQAADFSLSSYNLKPIGSGPYQIKSIDQQEDFINSLTLTRNSHYHQQPYLNKITFKFYRNEEELVKAARKGKVDGLAAAPDLKGLQTHEFSLPRYFAVFFNPDESQLLKDEKVRKALNYATNRKALTQGKPAYSPILPSIFNFKEPSQNYAFDQEQARNLLKEAGFKDKNEQGIRTKTKETEFEFTQRLQTGRESEAVTELQKCLVKEVNYEQKNVTGYFGNKTEQAVIEFQEKYQEEVLQPYNLQAGTGVVGPSTREKLNQVCFEQPQQPLSLTLTLVEQSTMKQVASNLQEQWKKVGVDLKLNIVPLSELKTKHIKTRNYESLLFGQSLGIKPDFYSFWHSSQNKDPGLNLAKFDSEQADKLLKKARKTLNEKERAKLYEEFQNILLKQAPAVFLYNPNFVYHTSEVEGVKLSLIVNPAHRFNSVKEWYLKTKRTWE